MEKFTRSVKKKNKLKLTLQLHHNPVDRYFQDGNLHKIDTVAVQGPNNLHSNTVDHILILRVL